MRRSDQIAIAVTVLIGSIGVGFSVASIAAITSGLWIVFWIAISFLSACVLAWLLWLGPDDVLVTFGEMGTFLSPVQRVYIRRTINRYYVFLRSTGLEPPTKTPLIRLGHYPDGVDAICSAPGSPAMDAVGIGSNRLFNKIDIAYAFTQCYFQRLVAGSSGTQAALEHATGAVWVVQAYFSHAFADTPFVAPRSFSDTWLSALLAIRLQCGPTFADKMMVYATTSASSQRLLPDEPFEKWFPRLLMAAMVNTTSFSNRDSMKEARRILFDRKLIDEP